MTRTRSGKGMARVALAAWALVSLAAAAHATPLATDLRLWLKADAGAFTDLGTTPATDGTTVRQWNDQLFGDNTVADDALQGTAANRPTYVANGLGGQPVLRFDNTDSINGSTITLTAGTAPRTVFVVGNRTGVTGDVGLFNLNRGPGGGPYVYKLTPEFAMRQGQGNRFWTTTVGATHAILAVQTPAPPDNDTDHTVAYKNGPAPLSVASTAGGTNSIDTGGAGVQGYQVVQSTYAGDFAEALVYERYLDGAEINHVGYYLQDKYGIAGSFTAPTQIFFDKGGADNDWQTAANWDPDGEPTAFDDAFIGDGRTATVTQAGEAANYLFVGHNEPTLPGTATLNVNAGSLTTTSDLNLGNGGNKGNVVHNGGTVTVHGDLNYGLTGGAGGTYRLKSGTLDVWGRVHELNPAVDSAQLYIDGGSLTVGGDITVQSFRTGDAAGSSASYTLTGGKTLTNTGTFFAGQAGDGTFILDDGTVTVSNGVRIGDAGSGVGLLRISGGTMSVNGGDLWFGNNGGTGGTLELQGGTLNVSGKIDTKPAATSTINLNGGTLATASTHITVDDLNVNPSPATGSVTYTRDGGTLTINNDLKLGGSPNTGTNYRATVTQNGGTVTVGNNLVFGGAANTEGGTYNFYGGTLNVVGDIVETAATVDAAQFHLDADIDGGGAVFTVGGSITTQRFAVGESAGRTGTYTLPTGKQLTTTGTFAVAGHGTGTFTLDGGTLQAANSIVAQYDEGIGTAHIKSGSFTASGYVHVGAKGDGTLNINGGTADFGAAVNLGHEPGGKGTLSITGGAVTLHNNLIVGEVAAADPGNRATIDLAGTVTQTAGNVLVGHYGKGRLDLVNGTLDLANGIRVGNYATGEGEMYVSGGTLDVGGNHVVVGNQGKGTLEITGGTGHTIASNLIIGNQDFTTSDGAVTIAMPDNTHTVAAKQVNVGVHGKGSLTFTEGTLNATSGFGLARNANASDHGGGDDRSATFVMGSPDQSTSPILNVSGGNFETAASGTGTVTLHSGTLNQQSNNIIIGQGASSVAVFNMDGGLVTMHNNGDLNFNDGQGTLNLDGGVFNVGRNINLSQGTGTATLHINPGGTLIVNGALNYRSGGTDVVNLQGGTLDMTGGTISFADPSDQFSFLSGRLEHVGTFGSSLAQDGGTLAPGGPTGTMAVNGAYSLNAGTLAIELASGAGFDVVDASGAVTLGGALLPTIDVDLLGGYVPDAGEYFDIVVADGGITNPDLSGVVFDFTDAQTGLGWWTEIALLGGGAEALRISVSPEPATLSLLALGGLALVRRRRRRQA